jgi:hypothetical protein
MDMDTKDTHLASNKICTQYQTLLVYEHDKQEQLHAGIEVLTAVLMKSSIFLDITPCNLLKDN